MEIKIREAVQDDITSIKSLWTELFEFNAQKDYAFAINEYAEKQFKKLIKSLIIDSEGSKVLVAEVEGNIVGYMTASVSKKPPGFKLKKYGHILGASVAPEFRRKGIGTKLYLEIIAWFYSRGIDRIEVNALTNNEISTSFWQKMGFVSYYQSYYLSKQD